MPASLPQPEVATPPTSSQSTVNIKYKILLYTRYYTTDWWLRLIGNHSGREIQCGQYKCVVTTNKREIGSSHAVVFHARASDFDLCISEAGKTHRLQSQRWILESPEYSHDYHNVKFKRRFNSTMTYKHAWFRYLVSLRLC